MPPSLHPQRVSKTAWYYEDKASLHLVVECRKDGIYHQTIEVRIPARKLRRSLARMAATRKPVRKKRIRATVDQKEKK